MFTYSIKRAREIRKFDVAIVQRRQGNVHKKRDERAKLMFVFVNLNLLLFCNSPCRRHRHCLFNKLFIVVIQNFATMVT